MLWVDDETPYERPFVRISTSSPPVIPLFLTIPNGFASLETVYIATKPDTNSSKLQYNPLYTFEVLSQKWQFKAMAICRTNIYMHVIALHYHCQLHCPYFSLSSFPFCQFSCSCSCQPFIQLFGTSTEFGLARFNSLLNFDQKQHWSKFPPKATFVDSATMFTINLWLYGVAMKLVPCLVLGVVTALLVHEMYKVPNKQ